MPTTIQLSEKTRNELLKIQSELQIELGRKVPYDEVIQYLILLRQSKIGQRKEFSKKYFGKLQNKKESAFDILKEGRSLERQ